MNPLSSYMKLSAYLSARLLLAVASACLTSFYAAAQSDDKPIPMIKNITASSNLDGCEPGKLIDGRLDTQYHSADENESTDIGDQYIEVTFRDLDDDDKEAPLTLSQDEDMVVYIQRCPGCDDRQPTVFRVMGQPAGSPDDYWEPVCHAYFLFRGKATKEYSSRIHLNKSYDKLRFYVVDNSSRSRGLNGRHSMGMAEFQIFKVKRGANYSEVMADSFHKIDDYKDDYKNYEFINTMGWLDDRNRSLDKTSANQPAWEDHHENHDISFNNQAWHKGEKDVQIADITKLKKWAKWDDDWTDSGEWKLDTDKLSELEIQIPDMSLITGDKDFDSKSKTQCQPTHVTEHILYALPGEPVILTPYPKFAAPKHYERYEVNFAHWYDYRTGDKIVYDDNSGNRINLLDFLADPTAVCISDHNGFYGAYLLTEKKDRNGNIQLPWLNSKNYGMTATFFCPRDPFDEGGKVLSLPFRDCDKAQANNVNDIDEFVIAADFSQSFNKGRNLDDKNKQIIEPAIAFRHIFRIRDGKTFAEDFSGSEEKNKAYVRRNRRDITARANQLFQIGLEYGVPQPWQEGGRWRSVPSEYCYKISDTEYRRINAMRIKVTDSNGKPVEDNPFYFAEPYDGLGSREIEGTLYGISGNGGQYYQMLMCDSMGPGKYKVEIIGQEIINQKAPTDIKVFGSDTELVVMEFDIDFVDSETAANPKALLVKADELYSIEKYEFAREEVLVKKYGEAKERIDFDNYRGLESLPTKSEYLDERIENSGRYQFKWPAAWNKSQYANVYSDGHDYNMYVIANHSSRTPYHNNWHKDNAAHNDDEKDGLYDRLYEKTTRLKKADSSVEVQNGYFLYVNAAADPGVMVTLNVDNICNSSTINVSAWVAEFSQESEKANIAFNMVAVLAGTGERINVHTYVSGYVTTPGVWTNIFYSFQPDVDRLGYKADMIDHYELELENNCKSSIGADYAIDDIAIYIVTPVIGAEPATPLCWDLNMEGENSIDKNVKIFAPFSETLRSIGLSEPTAATDSKEVKLSYVILDRKKYDEAYEEAKAKNSDDPETAAIAADGVKIQDGSVDFKSFFNDNPEYESLTGYNVAGRYVDDRGTKMIAFKVNFDDDEYAIGKEYYIAMYTQASGETFTPYYDLHDPCAKTCIYKVSGKNDVRLNGEIVTKSGSIKICEGEEAKISVDVKTEGDHIEREARCDWFKGTKSDLDAIEGLYKAMVYFREEYPGVESPEDESVITDDMFTQDMLKLIVDNKDKFNFGANAYDFGHVVKDAENVVTALPIPYVAEGEGNQVVCTAPMEIKVEVLSPYVLHGLRNVDYPEGMDDVPLRAGLDQLKKTVIVPLREVKSSGVSEDVKTLRGAGVVMLESTDDPNPQFQPETVTSSTGEKYIVKPDIEAGVIKSFDADLRDGSYNQFSVRFSDTFPFREGYEYTFSYQFEENLPEGEEHICKGKDLFTVKVVPEFLLWTPVGDNRNWNNDGNWQRVASDRLRADLVDDEVKERIKDKVTDIGNNSYTGAYVPMDFTKVIVPATNADGVKSPFMYDWNGEDATAATIAGDATYQIEYDMVVHDSETMVECGPWYANTCNEIHFLTDASIMNQQHLEYKKAWLDLELNPYRWYTLAMPLKKVFAGEFYLPTDNARQETELFRDITYDPEKNDRFNPAVFQRGWDKGKADIYHPDGSTSTAIVAANWSHVYNDVEESYGSGVGFSIKADVSGVNDATGKVLFRLPKADEEYAYYDNEGNELNPDNRKTILHGEDHYRLNDASGSISATNAGDNYYLVGNPFMTHLDMAKFLDANKEKVARKYWMITAGSQKMGVFEAESEGLVIGDALGYVAPMQGFFVEALDGIATSTLSLDYDGSMMYDLSATGGSGPLKISSRGYDEGFTLTISAIVDDEESTAAVVRVVSDASQSYRSEEDMVVLDNSDLEVKATVYTVSDGKALSVNSLDGICNVELGLIALPEEETVLRFDLDNDCSLNLYDDKTGAYTPIFDGMTYPVSGNIAGRLYLTATSGVKEVETSGITWSVSGDQLTVRSSDVSCCRLSVRVIDYLGRCVAKRSAEGSELILPIAPGVYVMEAETDSERLCVQVKI